jgi:hypothetical protein
MVGPPGFEPRRKEETREVKAPVTHSGCGAFAVYDASMPIPKSPANHPSNPAKTETVSVPPTARRGGGGGDPALCVLQYSPLTSLQRGTSVLDVPISRWAVFTGYLKLRYWRG